MNDQRMTKEEKAAHQTRVAIVQKGFALLSLGAALFAQLSGKP